MDGIDLPSAAMGLYHLSSCIDENSHLDGHPAPRLCMVQDHVRRWVELPGVEDQWVGFPVVGDRWVELPGDRWVELPGVEDQWVGFPVEDQWVGFPVEDQWVGFPVEDQWVGFPVIGDRWVELPGDRGVELPGVEDQWVELPVEDQWVGFPVIGDRWVGLPGVEGQWVELPGVAQAEGEGLAQDHTHQHHTRVSWDQYQPCRGLWGAFLRGDHRLAQDHCCACSDPFLHDLCLLGVFPLVSLLGQW